MDSNCLFHSYSFVINISKVHKTALLAGVSDHRSPFSLMKRERERERVCVYRLCVCTYYVLLVYVCVCTVEAAWCSGCDIVLSNYYDIVISAHVNSGC